MFQLYLNIRTEAYETYRGDNESVVYQQYVEKYVKKNPLELSFSTSFLIKDSSMPLDFDLLLQSAQMDQFGSVAAKIGFVEHFQQNVRWNQDPQSVLSQLQNQR